MTDIDTDKLRALDEAATPELKTVSPRIMAQLLRLGAEHQRPRGKDWERAKFDADGLLISTLLNGLPAILAMAEEIKELRDCLGFWAARQTCEEALADTTPAPWRNCSPEQRLEIIGARKELHDSEVLKARRALGKDQS